MPQKNAIEAVKHGRARALARREQVCVVNLAQHRIWSLLGFDNDGSRGRDPSRRGIDSLMAMTALAALAAMPGHIV